MSIKVLDVFSSPVNFYIDGEKSIKTNAGGLLSIVTVIIVLVLAWLIGNDIIYREKPFSYKQTNVYDSYPPITLNTTHFPLAFSMQNNDGQPMETDTYFVYELRTIVLKADDNGVLQQNGSVSYNLHACSKSDFPQMDQATYDMLGMSNFVCPENWNASLQGYWTQSLLIYLQFNVKMCDYTNNSTCKSKQEIENYISVNRFSMNLYFYTPEVVIGNYTNPLRRTAINSYTYLNPGINKNIEIFICQDDVLTDVGFFTEVLDDLFFLGINSIKTDSMIYDTTVNCLMQYAFYSNNTSNQTFRKYVKISDILASVGGIIKLVFLICQFLNSRFSEIETCIIINDKLKGENGYNKFFETASKGVTNLKRFFSESQIVSPTVANIHVEKNHHKINRQSEGSDKLNFENLRKDQISLFLKPNTSFKIKTNSSRQNVNFNKYGVKNTAPSNTYDKKYNKFHNISAFIKNTISLTFTKKLKLFYLKKCFTSKIVVI